MNDFFKKMTQLLANKNRPAKVGLMVLVPVAIVLFWLGSNFLASENTGTVLRSAKVKRGPMTIKLIESGELRAQDQVTISAVTDKRILWLVPEGKWVEKGDTLIRYESEKYEIARGEGESALLFAEAGLAKAVSDLEAQQMRENALRKSYEQLPVLVKKGFIMEYELDRARLAYIEAKSTTRSLEAALEAARAKVRRAEQAYAQQNRKLREGVVFAPRAGLVVYATFGDGEIRRKITVGMTPLEGMDLLYLPNVSSMLVDIQVSEVDLEKLKIGLPAEVRVDAYPEVVFKGEIKYIADLAKRKLNFMTGKASGAKIFEVTLHVHDRDLRLKPGLTATLDIILNEYANALYIPVDGIFFDGEGKTFVYAKTPGKITARPISIGESNDRFVIIKEGLQEGDEILLSRPSAL